MTKVTYLLGAGASYDAVPIVGEMEHRLFELINTNRIFPVSRANKKEAKSSERITRNLESLSEANKLISRDKVDIQPFYRSLEWLYKGMANHASVDTFAKKLFLKANEGDNTAKKDLQMLKFTLSAFLTIEQLLNREDLRYDKFFASILGENTKDLPPNINIISWNYDLQFEIAYSDYSNQTSMKNIQNDLNLLTKHDQNINTPLYQFSILKLNGDSNIYLSSQKKEKKSEEEKSENDVRVPPKTPPNLVN